MQIQALNCMSCLNQNMGLRQAKQTSFKGEYVTLSKANLGDEIAARSVVPFNESYFPIIRKNTGVSDFAPYAAKTDFWALAAGSGSRFKPLADAYTKITGRPANKISLPFQLNDGKEIHMLDWAMAMGLPFAENDKVEHVIAESPSGSFGDIVKHNMEVLEQGGELKDTVVCCGDNVFSAEPKELQKFVTSIIDDPNKKLGLVGVRRKPEEVMNKFGVLAVKGSEGKDDIVKLTGFEEKPKTIEKALEFALPDGDCIANTGMFVIKKEAMEALMDEIKHNPDVIKKNDKEPYDFAEAVKWVHGKYGDDASDVKLVKVWEDVGEPKALYSFLNRVVDGEFLSEFGKYGKEIQDSLKQRFAYDGEKGTLLLSERWNSLAEVPADAVDTAEEIDGVKIV